MSKLKVLFDKLNHKSCSYGTNKMYAKPAPLGIIHLRAKELLEITREIPEEKIAIACFGDFTTRISFNCYDESQIIKTIDDLRLPPYSPNLGEQIFIRLRDQVEKSNLVFPEEAIVPGLEDQLELVLKKLIHVYSGKKIDQSFYKDH